MALLFLTSCKKSKKLVIYDYNSGKELANFTLKNNDTFSISFIHSINKTPVTDYYKFNPEDNSIYVFKTVYYSFGAGVQTELNPNETITYGDDGSMTIEHIDKTIGNLTYYLSDIYDHTLRINDGAPLSLWKICGKKKIILFKIR